MAYLACTKPLQSYFWELAFDVIMMGNYILNSNTDGLKAATNHRVEEGENCFF